MRDLTDDFPICKELNYLNAASIGPVPKPVIDYYTGFAAEISVGGTKTLDEEKEDMVYDGLRREGGRLLGCDDEDVAVFNSVSEALNCVAWSLGIQKGKLVSTDVEFPSVTYPLLRIAEMYRNVTVRLVEADDWIIPVDSVLDEIDENTRAVFITHVENLSGQINDIARITEYAHDKGALVVVDGIQAAGCLPLEVKKLGVDVYITGSYKYLCAPFGAAIAYISKELYEIVTPVFVGWRTSEVIWDFDAERITYPSTARKFEYSTSAYGVKLGLAESIKYLLGVGIQGIHSHDLELVRMLEEEFEDDASVEVITPKEHGSIFTFRPLNVGSGEVAARLRGSPRPVELSVRQGLIRLSPHLYNTQEDVREVIEILKQVL